MPKASPANEPVEKLVLKYVDLDEVAGWDKNPKRHDLASIMESIRTYGFKDPPKFEPTLNEGRGGLVEGNGRDKALLEMRKMDFDNPPRGVLVKGGKWLVPILYGVDAQTVQQAEAYAVDHNNLTMLGGDFTPYDVARMWDIAAYEQLLNGIAGDDTHPVTMDAESLAVLKTALHGIDFGFEKDRGEDGGDARRTKITLVLDMSEVTRLEEIVSAVRAFLDDKGYKVVVDA